MPKTKTHADFVQQADRVHGSNYLYLTQYTNATTKIKIQHKECGFVFFQRPNNHISHRQGCPQCGINKRANSLRKTHSEFLCQADKIHNSRYVYLEEYVNDASKMKIQHKECGHIFYQRVSSHLSGQGCPECSSSKGELMIKHWLEKSGVDFIYQHKFEDCVNPKTNRKLKFDFFLPKYKTAIEFDGLQHYKPVRFVGMSDADAERAFLQCKKLDKIKNKFCKQNNIELVRIGVIRNNIDNDKVDEILLEIIS